MWPCIVTNSYNILISQICSWNETLHVSDSSSVHHQEFYTVHTAMLYVIQVCWQLVSRIRMDPVPSWSCSQAVSKPVWHIALVCVQCITPDDGQRNYPKHVEFHSKNKFEKLVHLDGFIIRIYHDARSRERQKINILIKIFKNVARITQKINIFLINKLSVLHILFVNFIAGQLKFLIGRCNTVHGIYDWLFPCTCGHIVEF